MSSAEFFDLTPRQYHLLMDRYREEREHQELCAAIVAYNIATFAGKQLKDGVELSVTDFMPSQKSKPKEPNRDRVADMTRAAFEALIKKQEEREKQKATTNGS